MPSATTLARAEVKLTPVATSGEPVPGLEGARFARIGEGAYFGSGTGLYHMAGSGKLAFAAGVIKEDGDRGAGIWTRYEDDEPIQLAHEPDFSDEDDRCTDIVDGPFPLANGDLAVLCSIPNGDSPQRESLFFGAPGHLQLQIRNGSVAPGYDDVPYTFFRIRSLKVREPGIIAFDATVNGTSTSFGDAGSGVWIWSPDSFELVLAEGSAAPGVKAQHIVELRLHDLNGAGHALIGGTRSGSEEALGRQALWAGSSASDVALVAADQDPTTLADEPLVCDTVWQVNSKLTDADQVVMLSPHRRNQGTERAAWVGAGGTPLAPLVAQSGARLTPAALPIAVTRGGKIALSARYEVEPRRFDSGLWVGTPDALRLIAKDGAALRGMADTVLQEVRSIQLNERGQMIVAARVLQADEPKQKLLRYSPAAGFEPIVELDAIIDDHGTERAIADITDFCDMQEGKHEQCLDDDGRFAFMVMYSDQTQGLMVTDPMPAGGEDIGLDDPGQGSEPGGESDESGEGGEDGEDGGGGTSATGPSSGDAGASETIDGSPTTDGGSAGTGTPSSSEDSGCSFGSRGRSSTERLGLLGLALLAAIRAQRRRLVHRM